MVRLGETLTKLHIGYEAVAPFSLKRADSRDEKARSTGYTPKPALKPDIKSGRILVDTETTLSGVPPEAWEYKLANRSAIEWVLDQFKETKPKDRTIREKFDSYRFSDYKEIVIDLLKRVTTVSVETAKIIRAMKSASRS